MSEMVAVASSQGEDGSLAEDLLPLVYEELRRLASVKLVQERPGQTLQPTALVHEAYLKLTSGRPDLRWQNRDHFFAAAGEAMRRILVDRARRRDSQKGGGGWQRISLDELDPGDRQATVGLLEFNEALEELESYDDQAAQLVKLRFFAGLGHREAAEAMRIERRVADRLWLLARNWLFRRLSS
jgi:RNA polymerase sigma factor (TIGR02999 family)